MSLLDSLFGSDAIDTIFTDSVRLQRMLDFEAALAKVEAKLGIIPSNAAVAIENQCRADLFDTAVLSGEARKAGNLAIPMVKQLTKLVEQQDKNAARYIHWGATSQDAIDTGLVLQLRDAFRVLATDLDQLCAAMVRLASAHRTSVVPARTWMQHAIPTVFGFKVAGWLDAMTRHRERLQETGRRVLVLQLGGAAGTLASLGSKGLAVAKALAEELELELPALPWHAHRDRVAEVATTSALLTGTLGKMARDISLEGQSEVAEVAEPAGEGRGGSSTMPQKRNPVACAVVLSAAARVPALTAIMLSAMPQEHERGLGGWHAEWETLPEIVRLTGGALHRMLETISALEVNVDRMRQNLDVTQGLIFAEAIAMTLAERVGKAQAHRVLEAASRKAIEENRHLRDVIASEPQITEHLAKQEIDKLFDPLEYAGCAGEFLDRAIAENKARGH